MSRQFPSPGQRTPLPPVEEAGVQSYSVYNRMLIPGLFRSLEEDYAHLKLRYRFGTYPASGRSRSRVPMH
ncbi:MAG: hypothetical protein CM1200mP18_19610 [Gammaproteobacteria bacterium]|nr:MAG: hypothetical protein CM1200mP18_19610 [Gammaproteobacteria bacterium]